MFCRPSSRVPFAERIRQFSAEPIRASGVSVLQVNLGNLCNMACAHCHINAGPHGGMLMDEATVETVLDVLRANDLVLDLTGGAPELHPRLTHLVSTARSIGRHVIVRTNLTVLMEEGRSGLGEFFAGHGVELIASLPSYREDDVDMVRGRGAFRRCVEAIMRLNSLGYGTNGRLELHLVHNPPGPSLPSGQEALEREFKKKFGDMGISFDRLFTFANAPIGRFKDSLLRSGGLEAYAAKLSGAFNPSTLEGLMCRDLISVGWDGRLHDCDFNLALGIGVDASCPQHVSDFDLSSLSRRDVVTGDHCYACAAGQGST